MFGNGCMLRLARTRCQNPYVVPRMRSWISRSHFCTYLAELASCLSPRAKTIFLIGKEAISPIGGDFCRSCMRIDLREAAPGQLTNEGHRRRTTAERWRWATGGHSSVNCRAEDARCYASTCHGLTPAGVLDRRKQPPAAAP